MRKRYRLAEGQEYIAGRRGIRFQDIDKVMKVRKHGEPVPEAVNFKNIRILVDSERLIIKDKSGYKKPELKKPEPMKVDDTTSIINETKPDEKEDNKSPKNEEKSHWKKKGKFNKNKK